MALKFFYIKFPSPFSNGTVYVNNSNAYVLIVGILAVITGPSGGVYVVDEYSAPIADLVRVSNYSESLSVSGSDTFSTSASTSTGIASTSESINQSISGLAMVFSVVFRKTLVPPGWSVVVNNNAEIYGFQAIQADTIEELRGFL